jgi:hypothetical protein
MVLPVSGMIVLVLLLGIGCTPLSSRDRIEPTVGPTVGVVPAVEVTETPVPYPIGDEMTPAVEPIPAEETRAYPPLDELPVGTLPTPEIGGPEEPGPGELPRVIGEVPPDLLEEIIADLVQRTGAERSTVHVLQSEQVVWPDGSLGCPQPGMVYTQALVGGYQVMLEHGGETYDYRASEKGTFILCENR